jgi:LysM repeat protein
VTVTSELLPLPSATPSLAATPRPATPAIIATFTPIPTPVTYVVQAGDTLVGIAWSFGISVEALQTANPNVQPAFLSVGAVLVIPPPEGTPVAQLAGVPTPAPLELSLPACYPTATNALYCFVEARNPGALALENVSAQIIVAGADGLPIASQLAYAAREVIPPGESAPLAVLFAVQPDRVAASAARVATANESTDPALRYVLLEVSDQQGGLAGNEWRVTGQIRNPTSTPASAAWMALTLYDALGAIVGYRRQSLTGGLAPGETRDFSISAASLGGAVDHYRLAAEGRP